jgi:phage shock protein PspC (stress-responsive transcriptional regulator)
MSGSFRPAHPLQRSSSKMIAGVCAGLSEYFGINVVFTRVIFLLMGLNGIGVLLYILLLLLPAQDSTVPPTASPWPNPYYTPSPAANPQPKARKSVLGYMIGLVTVVGSFIATTTTFMSNVNTIIAFVGSLIGPAEVPQVYIPMPSPTKQSIAEFVDERSVVFRVRDELGDNQIAETVVVSIDGETVGTISIDADHPSATLRIRAPRAGLYSYTLTARTTFNLNGERCETSSSGSGQIDVRSNAIFRLAGDITGCTVNSLSLEE